MPKKKRTDELNTTLKIKTKRWNEKKEKDKSDMLHGFTRTDFVRPACGSQVSHCWEPLPVGSLENKRLLMMPSSLAIGYHFTSFIVTRSVVRQIVGPRCSRHNVPHTLDHSSNNPFLSLSLSLTFCHECQWIGLLMFGLWCIYPVQESVQFQPWNSCHSRLIIWIGFYCTSRVLCQLEF